MRRGASTKSYYRIIFPRERTPALLGKQCGGGIYVNLGCEVVEIDAAAMFADKLIENYQAKNIPKSQGAVRPQQFKPISRPGPH